MKRKRKLLPAALMICLFLTSCGSKDSGNTYSQENISSQEPKQQAEAPNQTEESNEPEKEKDGPAYSTEATDTYKAQEEQKEPEPNEDIVPQMTETEESQTDTADIQSVPEESNVNGLTLMQQLGQLYFNESSSFTMEQFIDCLKAGGDRQAIAVRAYWTEIDDNEVELYASLLQGTQYVECFVDVARDANGNVGYSYAFTVDGNEITDAQITENNFSHLIGIAEAGVNYNGPAACYSCHGSGRCPVCGGFPGIYGVECEGCHGTGVCYDCHGSGVQ